ncbi:divalent-cation tolerance protein CutA [Deinococcus ruber]|uniref:Divalent ion tolerance protein CutA n=1 Tax=Deinococcus ruber TaxID=1848197 RepID=A0A918KX80_9DEIO|nr:divalent-cation tolerance protein CutA [Deinococcus ruber]GGR38955.1 divalent ion tolerance protein CutA [Deinococcus ruber]
MTLIALITMPEDQARELARTLVRERLAGSVNVLPGTFSVYRWNGDAAEDTEALMIVKTTQERYPALEERVRALHPYQIPEIVALPTARTLPAFAEWLYESVEVEGKS